MKDRQGRRPATGIKVGNVQGTGIVIGHESSASVELHHVQEQRDAAALLDEFVLLLTRHEALITDADEIRESAAAARAELVKPSPKWPVVQRLLAGIAASVASVSVLAEAVSNIFALVAHLAA